MYIHRQKKWPNFFWEDEQIVNLLSDVRYAQGKLLGKMMTLGFDLQEEAVLEMVALEVIKNYEIEGELLDRDSVKSSIARKLGMDYDDTIIPSRQVDGAVEMMLDATQHFDALLTTERLFSWHGALFPTGRSGLYQVTVGDWRQPEAGPMRVVSGGFGRECIHFEAPVAKRVPEEMEIFLKWFNQITDLDPVVKAAIAHLWFLTIHPFDDGNGRIARAITELQLARSDKNTQRFYSLSNQILTSRKDYYHILEQTQRGDLDITDWIIWFLNCLATAIELSEQLLNNVLVKAQFWQKHQHTPLNERQHTMLNKLLGDFKGKLSTSKWAKMCKCSTDTALRDIKDLETKGILSKEQGGGRSTRYIVNT